MTEKGPSATVRGSRLWVMAKGYFPDEGGMQTYAQGVAEAYARLGAKVTVFTQSSVGPRREQVGNVLVVDIGPGKSAKVPTRFVQAMRRELRHAGAPALVHATTWRTSVPPMLLGLPYIVTFHGREFMYARGIVLWLMRVAARRAFRIVTVSHYSAARLAGRLGAGSGRAVVAWNGLSNEDAASTTDPVKHSQIAGGVPLIFSLCRLEPRKNIAAAVKACAAAKAAGYNFRYIIGGRGPELQSIVELVRELALEDRVTVAGFLPSERVEQLYREADVFLHPQIEADGGRDFEGFGIAIADAMATATAVIAGNSGGTRELIENEVSGFTVDGQNANELVAVLESLLADPSLRQSIGHAARERALSLFTWDRHVQLALGQVPAT